MEKFSDELKFSFIFEFDEQIFLNVLRQTFQKLLFFKNKTLFIQLIFTNSIKEKEIDSKTHKTYNNHVYKYH